MTYVFQDRRDAGRQLAAALPKLDQKNTVVVALPRGGVPVAEEICMQFHLPLDLVFVRKIGVPYQPELAVGAVVDGDTPEIIVNPQIAQYAGLSQDDIARMAQALLPEIARRKETYLQGAVRPELAGKTLVVVDDGVATGATLRASLAALKQAKPSRIILALPTAPPDVLPTFTPLVDEVICLHQPQNFHAVGEAYARFGQTDDAVVVAAVQHCAQWRNQGSDPS